MKDHNDIQEKLAEHDLRLDTIDSNINALPTKGDIEEIVRATLLDVLFKTGRVTKATIITIAIIVGSFAVLFGGVKWLLGFIGFTYMK